MMTVCRSWEAD